MGTFDDLLKSGESLFRNEIALDYSYLPKIVPYREAEMRQIASCMKPLFDRHNGRNMLVFGPSGVGKTAACRHLLEELQEQTDEITPLYINCWQRNTSFKILVQICAELGYKFTQNKRSDELFVIVRQLLNKKAAVFVFDEADKMDDLDFLYSLIEEIYRKSIILITNHKDWLATLDARIRSRLTPDVLEFRPYTSQEIAGILAQRREWAFAPGVWDDKAFDLVVAKTTEVGDIRSGLYLLNESCIAAENRASRRIEAADVARALEKFHAFQIKDEHKLDADLQLVLDVANTYPNAKIGDLHRAYQEVGGQSAYKTFQRRIAKLEQDRFITTEKVSGGAEGSTTIVHPEKTKKLTEY